MITKILLENFKSFERLSELTLISSSKIRTSPEHRMQIKSTKLLRYGVVYGANASGKTNLVEFFRFFLMTLKVGLPSWSSQLFCKNNAENKHRESFLKFNFQFATLFTLTVSPQYSPIVELQVSGCMNFIKMVLLAVFFKEM